MLRIGRYVDVNLLSSRHQGLLKNALELSDHLCLTDPPCAQVSIELVLLRELRQHGALDAAGWQAYLTRPHTANVAPELVRAVRSRLRELATS